MVAAAVFLPNSLIEAESDRSYLYSDYTRRGKERAKAGKVIEKAGNTIIEESKES